MGKISGSHCLVLGCRNRQLLNQTNTRSYFRFPRDAELCKKWVDFCSRPELYKKYDENGPEYLYKSSRICSDHFQPTDFNNPNLFSQGLKKGSIPTVNPATHETKTNNGTGAGGAPAGGGGGGSGSSNGAGSPIDEKLLSAVASIPNLSANLSLMVAAAVHAAQQSQQQQQQLLLQANSGLNATNLKRSAAAMSGSGGSGALQLTTASGAATTTNSTTTTPSSGSSSAKRNRAVPPLATPTGALANLIQRHQQIKEQQIKEQQRKAALGGSGLVNGQVSITSVPGARTSPTLSSAASRGGGPISLVTSKKSATAANNNNNVSHHNHNHKANHEQKHDQSDFGLNLNDTDMTGGESSEGDSSYQNSADEDYAYHQKQKVAKVEAVIPPSLKSQLTVTPATINNNTIHSTNGGGGALATSPTNGTINYKEKYEQTLKELFACRKIVKNQNKAIKQLQGEIDFLNQLLKEK